MYAILHEFCVIRYSDTARKPDQLPPMDNGATGTDVKQSAALPSIGKLENDKGHRQGHSEKRSRINNSHCRFMAEIHCLYGVKHQTINLRLV